MNHKAAHGFTIKRFTNVLLFACLFLSVNWSRLPCLAQEEPHDNQSGIVQQAPNGNEAVNTTINKSLQDQQPTGVPLPETPLEAQENRKSADTNTADDGRSQPLADTVQKDGHEELQTTVLSSATSTTNEQPVTSNIVNTPDNSIPHEVDQEIHVEKQDVADGNDSPNKEIGTTMTDEPKSSTIKDHADSNEVERDVAPKPSEETISDPMLSVQPQDPSEMPTETTSESQDIKVEDEPDNNGQSEENANTIVEGSGSINAQQELRGYGTEGFSASSQPAEVVKEDSAEPGEDEKGDAAEPGDKERKATVELEAEEKEASVEPEAEEKEARVEPEVKENEATVKPRAEPTEDIGEPRTEEKEDFAETRGEEKVDTIETGAEEKVDSDEPDKVTSNEEADIPSAAHQQSEEGSPKGAEEDQMSDNSQKDSTPVDDDFIDLDDVPGNTTTKPNLDSELGQEQENYAGEPWGLHRQRKYANISVLALIFDESLVEDVADRHIQVVESSILNMQDWFYARDNDDDEIVQQTPTTENEPVEPTETKEKKTKKSVNTEFVEGLDDIDKFFEGVDPPDELDIGAAGSSIQDVLMSQSSKILLKRISMAGNWLKKSFALIKEKVAARFDDNFETSDSYMQDSYDYDSNEYDFAGTLIEKTAIVGNAIRDKAVELGIATKDFFELLFDSNSKTEDFNFSEYNEGIESLRSRLKEHDEFIVN